MDIDTIGCLLSPVYESELGVFDMEHLNKIIRFDMNKIRVM